MNISDIQFNFKRYALHERGMRPKSYKSIMASVRMLCDWADTDELKKLDHGTVRAFLHWGREERAWEARTFRNHRQYLRSFFHWCLKNHHIRKNPTDGIDKPRLPRRLPRSLTREQVQKILGHVRWQRWHYRFEAPRNEAILYFLIYTGLRLQEMLDMEISDVNLTSREILVRQGKGQKDRIVPMHPRLQTILRGYLLERKQHGNFSRYLFTGAKSDKPMPGKNVRAICQKLSQSTDCYFTPHMLRHTFGRLAVEAGMDIFKIKEVMGHSEITTTQGYLSVSTENLKRSMSDLHLL